MNITPRLPPGPPRPCPACSTDAEPHVHYTAPLLYECAKCGATWNEDAPALKILTGDEARAKRPELYEDEP